MEAQEKKQFKSLIASLCKRFSKDKDDVSRVYYKAIEQLKNYPPEEERGFAEIVLAEKIRESLSLSNSAHLIRKFDELHRRLQSVMYLRNVEGILEFLWRLSSLNRPNMNPTISIPTLAPNVTFRRPTPSRLGHSSVPVMPSSQSVPAFDAWQRTGGEAPGLFHMNASNSLSGFSGAHSRDEKLHRAAGDPGRVSSRGNTADVETFQLPVPINERKGLPVGKSVHMGSTSNMPRAPMGNSSNIPRAPMASHQQVAADHVLVQELIFSFQGIPGTILKIDPTTQGFKIDPQFILKRPQKRMVQQMLELGWMHNRLRRFCEEADSSHTLGLMQKSFVTAIRSELQEYYRWVAVLQSRVQMEQHPRHLLPAVDSPLSEDAIGAGSQLSRNRITLCQLGVMKMETTERLRVLLGVVEAASELKGGELASVIYSFSQHGSDLVQSTVSYLLKMVCKPLYVMMSRWVVDGELEDPFGEFFVAADAKVIGERLWHDKYCVKRNLVPSFIPQAEANKILATGKCINFLREVCEDHTPIGGRDRLRQTLDSASVEALFDPDHDGELHQVMDAAYRETSRRVLDVLFGPHKFLENLHAIRRYLLLGQGDFIRHLMEIVNEELCKPAVHLQVHHLWGILDSAVRATNAQFEDPDMLKMLDVRLLEPNQGDIGWDVFTLDYRVSGPINTVFERTSLSYLSLFHHLWRNKRMEYILADCWKQQTTAQRTLYKVREVVPVLKRVHFLTAEMIHLVQQMQYYTLFEVIECSWHEMLEELGRAESLDGILSSHEKFVNKVKVGVLLDEESSSLARQVRAIYGLVLQLRDLEQKLRETALKELAAREQREQCVEARGEEGAFGTSAEEEKREAKARHEFINVYLPNMHTKLRVLTGSYQSMVKQFLIDLAAHPNANLQLLSFRLDFNDHYKRRDSRLAAPHTYQHRRLSEMAHRSSLTGMSPMRQPPPRGTFAAK